MEFLKRHYEKVILLGLFVIFIGLMFMVQGVISSTREVKESDLHLPQRTPDYQQEDENDDKFNTVKRWNASNFKWNKPETQADSAPVSDLVSAVRMTACPAKCSANGTKVLIPLYYFDLKDGKGKCPECGSELFKPENIDVVKMEEKFYAEDEGIRMHEETSKVVEDFADTWRQEYDDERKILEEFAKILHDAEAEKLRQEEEARRLEEEKDKDDDGVLDELEQQYGMDSNDKFDILYDNDGDGFTNIFEIENGFKPNDPKNHPPLWWRLQIKSISQIELPVKFMALVDNNSDDKSTWQLQFNYPDPRRPGRITSQYLTLGGRITIDNKIYKVADIERIITEKKREAGTLDSKDVIEKINESRVTLIETNTAVGEPDKLIMVVNQKAFSNDRRPVLVDVGSLKRRESVMRIGDVIPLGIFAVKDGSGREGLSARERRKEVRRYRLKSVDVKNMSIVMEDVTAPAEKGKPEPKRESFTIDRNGKIPSNRLVIKKVERSNDGDDLDDTPMIEKVGR